ncbi:MAG: 4Fe-4S dicluster domain-containing protein [Thermoplasmata archaeon]|nr:4Fe-4S dicluster domain-containing protein [Thermoplasmata archaeon]
MAHKPKPSDYSETTKQLKVECKKLITQEDIKCIIGWEPGSYGFRVSPSFAELEEEVEKFIWSPFCINNLAVYPTLEEKIPLPRGVEPDARKTGIVVKGCDSRALVQMLEEKGCAREQLVIIGIPCSGIIDPGKLEPKLSAKKLLDTALDEGYEVQDKDNDFIFKIKGKELKIAKSELMYDKCKVCKFHTPLIYDILVGEELKDLECKPESFERVQELDAKTPEQKWEYWEKKFERCIRCYACRNICPMCFCKVCIADNWQPQWIRRSVNVSENTMFHVMRAFHMAGRCVDCGECERACPMDIPLMELNKKLQKDVKELFEYEAGIDIECKPLLAIFKPDDPEEFVL